jgi:DNA-binding CsgD family transcriptional regulator/PAS domain-containing protein
MDEDEAIADLAGDIYDAALDDTLRPAVMEKIAAFIGGVAGWVVRRDRLHGTGEIVYHFGCQLDHLSRYFDTYIGRDPIDAAVLCSSPGDVICDSSVMPRSNLAKTPIYQEWMQPQGWQEKISITLARTPSQLSTFVIARGKEKGWTDETVHRRLHLLLPHLLNAALIVTSVRLQTGQLAALADMLDSISAGVFLIDAEGQIVYANNNGHAMLVKGIQPGALIAQQNRKKHARNRPMLGGPTAHGRMAVSDSIALPVQSADGESYVAHFLPLSPERRREAAEAYRAVMAVFVQKAELADAAVADVIGRHYRLTPTELRVLLTVIEAGGVAETASVLGIAETTVKTHLRRLFSKTGTRRQLELARLVAGFASALPR